MENTTNNVEQEVKKEQQTEQLKDVTPLDIVREVHAALGDLDNGNILKELYAVKMYLDTYFKNNVKVVKDSLQRQLNVLNRYDNLFSKLTELYNSKGCSDVNIIPINTLEPMMKVAYTVNNEKHEDIYYYSRLTDNLIVQSISEILGQGDLEEINGEITTFIIEYYNAINADNEKIDKYVANRLDEIEQSLENNGYKNVKLMQTDTGIRVSIGEESAELELNNIAKGDGKALEVAKLLGEQKIIETLRKEIDNGLYLS